MRIGLRYLFKQSRMSTLRDFPTSQHTPLLLTKLMTSIAVLVM